MRPGSSGDQLYLSLMKRSLNETDEFHHDVVSFLRDDNSCTFPLLDLKNYLRVILCNFY